MLAFILFALPAVCHAETTDGDRGAARAESVSLGRLTSSLLDQQSKLVSLRAHLRSWNVEKPGNAVITVVAAKGAARYESFWHEASGRMGNDPTSYVRYYDGKNFNLWQPYGRRYEVSVKYAIQPYLEKIQTCAFFECLGWWPKDDPTPPFRSLNEPEFLTDIVRDRRLRLCPDSRVIDGVRCVGAEIPSLTRIWCDPEKGIVRRRERFYRRDGADVIFATYDLMDYREFAGGVWLPSRIQRSLPEKHFTSLFVVESYEVNCSEEDWFGLSPPPGTLVYDRDNDTFRQIPGGLDGLEIVTRRIRDDIGEHQVAKSWPESLREGPAAAALFLSTLSTVVVRLFWRRSHVRVRPAE
jgi:hypothetical protein